MRAASSTASTVTPVSANSAASIAARVPGPPTRVCCRPRAPIPPELLGARTAAWCVAEHLGGDAHHHDAVGTFVRQPPERLKEPDPPTAPPSQAAPLFGEPRSRISSLVVVRRRSPRHRSGSSGGTTVMRCRASSSSGRSHEESVTMRIASLPRRPVCADLVDSRSRKRAV